LCLAITGVKNNGDMYDYNPASKEVVLGLDRRIK